MKLKDSFPPLELEFPADEAKTRPDTPMTLKLTEAELFDLRRLERNWIDSSPDDRRLIQAVAVRVRSVINEKP